MRSTASSSRATRRVALGALTAVAVLSGCAEFYHESGGYTDAFGDCRLPGVYLNASPDDRLRCSLESQFLGCGEKSLANNNGCLAKTCPRSLCEAAGGTVLTTSPALGEAAPALGLAAAIPSAQRAALLALYAATGGQDWFDNSGWGGSAGTECDWFGVLCNAARTTVTGLDFDDNGLRGHLPPELAGLTELQVLSLDHEPLDTQPFPLLLTKFPKLEILVLRDLPFTGPVPVALTTLSRLRALVLEGEPQLSGPLPPGLFKLPALESLELARLNLSGPLPDLSALKNLRSLRISETGLGGPIPASWAALTKLQSLVLADSKLSGPLPAFIGSFSQLRNLSLDANGLQGAIPGSLGNLHQLRVLNLSFNKLTGPIPASIGNLTQLVQLSLVGNTLSGPLPALVGFDGLVSLAIGPAGHNGPFPPTWMSLRQIRSLYLPRAGLTGAMPDLSLFSDLAEVNLEDNAFDPGPVPSWVGALPDLTKILLAGTRRQGAIPDLSVRRNQLTHFGLGRNAFTPGDVPSWLSLMAKLKHLDLEETGRTGAIPAFLGSLRLTSLDLSGNPFTPGAVPDWSATTLRIYLSSLDLGATHRTGAMPAFLAKYFFLQRLILSDNQLSGTLAATSLPNLLTELDLGRNRLGGALPAALGNRSGLLALRLAGNQFTGEVPATWIGLTGLYAGAYENPLYGKHVGLDLRYNALAISNAPLAAYLKSRHEGAVDPRLTQTIPPTAGKGTAVSSSAIKVTWSPIAFQGPGGTIVQVAKAAAGPFRVAGQTTNKSAASLTLTGLQPHTKYFFRLLSTTPAHPQNPNALTSAPSAVFAGATP